MIIDHPTREMLPGLWQLWQEAFGDDEEFLSRFAATAFSPSRCFALQEGEQLAAALYWFDCTCRGEKLAYLYAVATAKAFRGRGLCKALMAHTHRHLASMGYAGVILVPGEASLFRFYGEMGYRPFGGMEELLCTPKGTAKLHPLDSKTYSLRRRDYLPEGAVLQEGVNLAFLQCYATFYEGKDFLLAARREGDRLMGLELLGEADAAGGILQALGCSQGCFRRPGQDPFAMFLPLKPTPAPTYFAFAFD